MNEIQNTTTINESEATEEILAIEPDSTEVEEAVQVELSLEQIVDAVLDATKVTEFTMYQVHKVLNAVLEAIDAIKGVDEEGAPAAYRVRPQMVYNYNRNKMVVPKAQVDLATVAQVRAFVIKFATKFVR